MKSLKGGRDPRMDENAEPMLACLIHQYKHAIS